jgi:hypothetical protein
MPAAVVDYFELIEIEIAQRVFDLLGAHNGKCELQPLLKRSSVDQAGQRVVVRMVGELLGPSS